MTSFRATASIENLKTRAALLAKTRSFFDARGFFEVQTPLLSADTVVDRHIDPVPVCVPRDAYRLGVGTPMWLQTSPEFAMKRLLASGAEAIYQITPAFRIGESGHQHNPEFTMLEWYRRADSMDAAIGMLSELIVAVLQRPAAFVCTMSEAFARQAGFDPLSMDAESMIEACKVEQVRLPESLDMNDWDTCFDIAFTNLVQPKLGFDRPIIIHDYPASQSALAQIREGDPPVAERFELFIDGVELANGYHELLDADEFAERNIRVNRQRVTDGKSALPIESRLLEAMREGLPDCSGVALGFDRLVMLALGADQIDDVMPFPFDRA